MNYSRLRAIPQGLVITVCLLVLSACSGNDDPPVRRSDGVIKDFGHVTTPDLKKWVQRSDLPQKTKSLIDLYVGKIRVTKGFAGCLTEGRTEPLMNVELTYPDLGQYDEQGLDEQRDWSRRIISGLEEFAHTFEPGYFTEGGWIGGPTWVTDPKGGLDCSGSIEMGQLLTPAANMGTDYHQRDNNPIP